MADIHSKRRSTCHGTIVGLSLLSQMSGIFCDLFESVAFSVAPRSCPVITAVRNQPLYQDAKDVHRVSSLSMSVVGANIIILLFQRGDVNFDRRDVMTMRYDSALRGIDFKSKPNK